MHFGDFLDFSFFMIFMKFPGVPRRRNLRTHFPYVIGSAPSHVFLNMSAKHTEITQKHSCLLYKSPGGNQVDGLPPVAHDGNDGLDEKLSLVKGVTGLDCGGWGIGQSGCRR